MSSLTGNSNSQTPSLKGKVNQVKNLLDDASKRLQDEALKHGIFTTKTSASSIPITKQNGTGLKPGAGAQSDLKRTIDDIGTIQSVLSCPIFNRIVNVTDSLDKLSYHLNLRPSIGPSDINIDDNGELILAPPMEPTILSNFINSQFDGQYQTDHPNSPQQTDSRQEFSSPSNAPIGRSPNSNDNLDQQRQSMLIDDENDDREVDYMKPIQQGDFIDGRQTQQQQQQAYINEAYKRDNVLRSAQIGNNNNSNNTPKQAKQHSSIPVSQRAAAYDSEKLVTNGKMSSGNNGKINGRQMSEESGVERTRVKSVAAVFENAINNGSAEGRRLYKANGNFSLDQVATTTATNEQEVSAKAIISTANGQNCTSEQPIAKAVGYSNELYHGAHVLGSPQSSATEPLGGDSIDPNCMYANGNIRKHSQPATSADAHHRIEKPATTRQAHIERPARASPTASADSTVRLADECDSGTSSFRSQAAKGVLYSPQSHKPIPQLDEDPVSGTIDQELIDKLSPEMERIKVTLEKGPEGIGITIAGYICEQEEINGIFIKGITPGGPADRCGKIRILDQIFAVNGEEILGYSNPKATSVLRSHTGKVVTLELMRYLTESRYQKLQNFLVNVAPAIQSKESANEPTEIGASEIKFVDRTTVPLSSPKSIESANLIQSSASTYSRKRSIDQSSNEPSAYVSTREAQQAESIYNNSSVFRNFDPLQNKPASDSPSPIAAQRYSGPTNRVIETKQGARNTIDIRSPMCQTTATATYVNRMADAEAFNSSTPANISLVDRLRQEAPDEFARGVEPEWEEDMEIVDLQRDVSTQGLGFTVKEYNDPKDQRQSIIMITSITPGGIAEMNGKLSLGDLLVCVDDKNLKGASLNEAVKALKETNGQVRLGVLKFKR